MFVLLLLVLSISSFVFAQSGRRITPKSSNAAETTDVYKTSEVDTKALITYKPQPLYSTEARKKNVSGIVVLHLILASSGEIKNITVVKGLPEGLTEEAIEAAKQIEFSPAIKDGKKVSQLVTVVYNFIIDGLTVLADSSKKVYYIADMMNCAHAYSKIAYKDLVTFHDYKEAEAAGYVAAKTNCP
jgi:TonB family protein